MTIRMHLVTDDPARALGDLLAADAAPSWLAIAADPFSVARIEPPATVFALLYAARGEMPMAWSDLRERYHAAGADAGLTAEQLSALDAIRIRRGVAPHVWSAVASQFPGGVAGVRS